MQIKIFVTRSMNCQDKRVEVIILKIEDKEIKN